MLEDLEGLWRREYIRVPGAREDRATSVTWLQGGRFFCDLRQPHDLPSCSGVRCLRDLSPEQLMGLARQESFAGELTLDGDVAEWHRQMDFQPDTGFADRARLTLEGEALLEAGTERPYVERWVRARAPRAPAWGARYVDRTRNRRGILVCVGEILMFSRSRAAAVSPGATLATCLATTELLEERQDLVDFETSIGRLGPGGQWWIERSTLPFKVGRPWRCRVDPRQPDRLAVDDVTDSGKPVTIEWQREGVR